ncbi:RING-type domain-containing protein [Aphelenchoides besseyi]|nr:RING-type domain-containing protein [Aphelenchoides besseyi]
MNIDNIPSLPHLLTRSTQTENSNSEPTAIDMTPTNANNPERGTSLTISTRETTSSANERPSDRPSLQFNVEINSNLGQAGFEALNLGDTDSAALVTLVTGLFRNVIQLIGFKCLVPEAHPFNCVLLFLVVVVLMGLRALVTSVSYVVLGFARLIYYYDLQLFKTCKTERLWTLLLRIISRNIIIFCIFNQTPYIDVLAFRMSETNGFLYTLFVLCVANLMVMDVSLLINVTIRMCPWIGRLQKKQLIKLFEYFAALTCSCLPLLQWYAYLQNIWLSLPYLILKMSIIANLIHRVFLLLKQCLRIDHLGVRPSKEELADERCIICYGSLRDDIIDVQNQTRCPGKAVKIPCGHIYGDQCLRNWLEEQNVCPLCRKTVLSPYTCYPSAFLFPPYLFNISELREASDDLGLQDYHPVSTGKLREEGFSC